MCFFFISMDTIPKRNIIASPFRSLLERFEKYLVFPFKNPNVYTLCAVLLSILFLLISNITIRLILLTIILLLDWMDGVAARKLKSVSKSGYLTDATFDRISEGIITASILGTWYGDILFFLYIINIILVFYSVKKGTSYLIAVRFFYLIILFVQFISYS